MSRESIKRAALELFRRYSYLKTSVEDIARAAGIGKGSVYLTFKSKEDILLSLLEDEVQALYDRNDSFFLDPSRNVEVKMEHFAHDLYDLLFQIRDLMFGSIENVYGRELQDVYNKFSFQIDRAVDYWVKILELHGWVPTDELHLQVRELILFLAGRFLVYVVSHDWSQRELIKAQIPLWSNRLFKAFTSPQPPRL
ncbi:MAG: TetR/AcrR family transcriptional regulator [Spirochaetales bacterium]|nr:TetR/AcrR family transcriptional regulator [Spirochaetales bacterium]